MFKFYYHKYNEIQVKKLILKLKKIPGENEDKIKIQIDLLQQKY